MDDFDEALDNLAVWYTCYTVASAIFAESQGEIFTYALRAAVVLLLYVRVRYD